MNKEGNAFGVEDTPGTSRIEFLQVLINYCKEKLLQVNAGNQRAIQTSYSVLLPLKSLCPVVQKKIIRDGHHHGELLPLNLPHHDAVPLIHCPGHDDGVEGCHE